MRTGGSRSRAARPARLRYTKAALLLFGLGLVTGLVVVVGEFSEWDYVTSSIMALGLVLLPLGLFADGRGIAALRWIARRFSRQKQSSQRSRTARTGARSRKPLSRTASSRAPRRARS
ncbi:MAG: hypothetical protein AB7H71_16490 [Alphaproteobacteria bacterium]